MTSLIKLALAVGDYHLAAKIVESRVDELLKLDQPNEIRGQIAVIRAYVALMLVNLGKADEEVQEVFIPAYTLDLNV